MTEDTMHNPRVLGCDVGKDTIVVFDSQTATLVNVANRRAAVTRFLTRLDGTPFLVCEATGGHEDILLAVATARGLPVHRADPRKASAFIRSLRSYGKSDPIDARGLARYGLERHRELPRWRPPPPAQTRLRALVRLRACLVQDRADYRRRLQAPGNGPDKGHIRRVVGSFTRQIAAVEKDIAQCVQDDPRLTRTVDLIKAIPGCGIVTAITLTALMPELGQLSRRQAAALAGLAPHPRQSGQTDAYRRVRGGRREVKNALFMAALAARRYHTELSAKFRDLTTRGKKPIVAVVAIARKLLTIINARIRDHILATQLS